uniref:Phosphatidylglycerophosphatase n=1 Tax=Bursaphelenchus xylophilus TaxID=6326 RepID=A0A1I7RSR8_BURXY
MNTQQQRPERDTVCFWRASEADVFPSGLMLISALPKYANPIISWIDSRFLPSGHTASSLGWSSLMVAVTGFPKRRTLRVCNGVNRRDLHWPFSPESNQWLLLGLPARAISIFGLIRGHSNYLQALFVPCHFPGHLKPNPAAFTRAESNEVTEDTVVRLLPLRSKIIVSYILSMVIIIKILFVAL